MSRILTLTVLLFSFLTLTAQPDPNKIDQLIAEAQQAYGVPGMAVGITYQGKTFLAKGYGVKEVGKPGSVDENTLFAIASNTKAFIGTMIGMLVEEGKLNWNDPVHRYLPYFELKDPAANELLTIRDLLCHRAGLGTFSGDVLWYKSERSAEEVLKQVKALEPAYPFRDGYGYSNLMFIAAGEVIKAVTGKTWHELAQEKIWTPIGMDRTIWSVDMLADNFAMPHKPQPDGPDQSIPWVNWDNMGAAGGIISSAKDMIRWMQLHLQGGKWEDQPVYPVSIQAQTMQPNNSFRLSANALKAMPERTYSGYGLGWGLMDYAGHWVVSHGGGYDGMYSKVMIVPDMQLGIVILTNTMKGISNPLSYELLDLFRGSTGRDWIKEGLEGETANRKRLADRLAERTEHRVLGTKPDFNPEDAAGHYEDELYGSLEVTWDGKKMELHFGQAPHLDATLTHWHFNTYQITWHEPQAWFSFGTVQFTLDNQGKVHGMEFDIPNDDIFFEEIHAEKE